MYDFSSDVNSDLYDWFAIICCFYVLNICVFFYRVFVFNMFIQYFACAFDARY